MIGLKKLIKPKGPARLTIIFYNKNIIIHMIYNIIVILFKLKNILVV